MGRACFIAILFTPGLELSKIGRSYRPMVCLLFPDNIVPNVRQFQQLVHHERTDINRWHQFRYIAFFMCLNNFGHSTDEKNQNEKKKQKKYHFPITKSGPIYKRPVKCHWKWALLVVTDRGVTCPWGGACSLYDTSITLCCISIYTPYLLYWPTGDGACCLGRGGRLAHNLYFSTALSLVESACC